MVSTIKIPPNLTLSICGSNVSKVKSKSAFAQLWRVGLVDGTWKTRKIVTVRCEHVATIRIDGYSSFAFCTRHHFLLVLTEEEKKKERRALQPTNQQRTTNWEEVLFHLLTSNNMVKMHPTKLKAVTLFQQTTTKKTHNILFDSFTFPWRPP